MKSLSTTLLFLLFFIAQDALGQVVQFRVPIVLQWGAKLDTVFVGVNSGDGAAVHQSSYDLDDETTGKFGPLGSYGETGAAPPDPDGNRVRFIDLPGRTQLTQAGGLYKYDFRGYTAAAQADTFVIEVTGAIVEGNDLKVSWSPDLSQYGSGWTINSRTPSAIGGVLKDMLVAPNEHIFAATGNPMRFAVVKIGANPVAAVEPVKGLLPTSYALEQNFPNPFNPSTQIHFSLPRASQVTLVLYNLLGQRIADVVNEFKPAGVYSVRVDAGNLASGTYFYRIQANGFIATRKLTILK